MRGSMPPFDGKLSGDAVQDGNQVLSTDASGLATITFPQAFKNPPIVLADGGNDEDVYVIPNPTTTSFVAQFRSKIYPNALITSSAVRIYWAAFPPSPTLIAGGGSVPGPPGSQGFQGSTGAQGFQGAAGSPGAQGSQGSQGAQGTSGSQGSTGTQGPQGFQGATGAQGTTGSQGTQGNTGTQGATGSQGSAGSQGSTGTQGSTGAQGTTGTQGSQGAQGSQGLRGFQGFQGANGAQGAQGGKGDAAGLRYTYVGVYDFGGLAPGQLAQSDDGFGFYVNAVDADGNDWTGLLTSGRSVDALVRDAGGHNIFGLGAPPASVGSGVYLLGGSNPTDMSAFTVSQPVWISATANGATGPQGAQGATGGGGGGGGSQGAQGAQGATGAQGSQGVQGATGAQGSVGTQGATGAQGVAGTNGTNGSQGAQGFQGATGAQGSQGFQGTTGAGSQGAQGAQGASGGGSSKANLYAVKTSDTSRISTTTQAADPHLTFTLLANTVYQLSALFIYDSSLNADIRWAWTLPTGATIKWTPGSAATNATAANSTIALSATASTTERLGGGIGVGTAIHAAPTGFITVGSTAGIATLTWAQNTSDATNTTMQTGSAIALFPVT